ncbi:hypothetical protein NQ318_004344 [Aromia moschata]|uniref:THAP-type domain-containing protein n=1 Tax=Aromia moschata TaxID=1265417 RepID=A0AAV8YQU7_9CUCU|nr:hypothetical protein NQ318_004344 [Aromia moschata]
MNRYCCVPRCSSWIKRDPRLTFRIFPEQGTHQVSPVNKFGQKERIDRRKAWILKLRIGKPVSKFMDVCSLHFADKDYFYRSKATVVPEQMLDASRTRKEVSYTQSSCAINFDSLRRKL